MLYNENWQETQQQFKAWWEKDNTQPLIHVTSPKKGRKSMPQWFNWGFAKNPLNPEDTVNQFEACCSEAFFGGCGFPDLWINLGAGIAATYMGAEARYRHDSQTVWLETPKSWNELEETQFDPSNRWWQTTKSITRYVVERSKGNFMVGITDLGGITDIIASLRGSQNLVIDMFRYPEKVKALSLRILDMWHDCYEELYRISEGQSRGNSAWMGLWARERWYPIQCDFSAMLSPRLFKSLALPYIKEQCERLSHVIYHFDGPLAIPHLNDLLSISELDGIQWTPGAGNPEVDSPVWLDLYRKIQEQGKLLVLLDSRKEGVEYLVRHLKPKGLLIRTSCNSEDEARILLKKVSQLSR